jgi:hypothetical protein
MSSRLRAAIRAGCIAGAVMLGCMMIGASRAGAGWDLPLRWIASTFGGAPALIMAGQASGAAGVPIVMAFGLTIHFASAVAFTWLFFLLTDQIRGLLGWRLVVAGLTYGVLIWAIMTWGPLRVFNDVMYARVQLMPRTFFAAHLVFGAVLAGGAGWNRKESLTPTVLSHQRMVLNLRDG